MPLVTASLLFIGAALIDGLKSKGKETLSKAVREKLKLNLVQYRPHDNDELEQAAYRAYLEATLQTCAALLERKGLKIEGWFRLGSLPEKMAEALRSMLHDAAVGVFTQSQQVWLEAVSRDHIGKLKSEKLDLPAPYDDAQFDALTKEIEGLLQPAEAGDREQALRTALAERVLQDLAAGFREPPQDFVVLVKERWFEYLCAAFQFRINQKPELANAFESRMLAKLVARSEWQHQLTNFAGESLKRIEAAQGLILEQQQEGFAGIESLLLPIVSFVKDEAARSETILRVLREESERVKAVVRDEGEKIRGHVDQRFDDLEAILVPQPSNAAEPLIHSLPTQLEIEGRETECATILRAMSTGNAHVVAFAAPGGFGKTTLLAKVIQTISGDDGKTLLDQIILPGGETIETHTGAMLHVDCRSDVKLSVLFANAGRLIGQEEAFRDIYNADAPLSDRLQEIFGRLSVNTRSWFVFDNFEPLLNEAGEISDAELRDFFSALFAGGHNIYALISAREVPKLSYRERMLVLEDVAENLFDGLPLANCISYLRRNGAAKDFVGSGEAINGVLEQFSVTVHRIPMALVWVVGYLRDTGFTLKDVLDRDYLFTDFDQGQGKDAERYESKGLKRLHYEQLSVQPKDYLPVLRLLAFFKRPVPKGALSHLVDEIELNKTLTRLVHNNLITHKESADAHTRFVNEPLAVNLYALHPIICENEFFETLPDSETLYETAAAACRGRAYAAVEVNRFAYGLELYDCAEKLYEHLTRELHREDLLNSYAAMLMNKGVALGHLTRLAEALAECDKAIVILERLVNDEQQAHLANDLASAYMNKGVALGELIRLAEALAEYDKAIVILERLVNDEQQAHLANDLAKAYLNKGVALYSLTRLAEALAEYDKAIAIRERLVNDEQQAHLANDLAKAYMNKGVALRNLTRSAEALAEYDKAIAILERLVNDEQQAHLANDLAKAYMNKGVALRNLTRSAEALAEYDKAIAILERLVNDEQQAHLANDLAKAYLNKGVALDSLTRLAEALVEYDKAIVILERLVRDEQQAHLANDLAMAYLNKALPLEKLEEWDSALSCYEQCLQARAFCVEQLHMSWIMPDLLQTLRYRMMTLLDLERWSLAARDVSWFRSLYQPYIGDELIDDGLKAAAGKEFTQMVATVGALSAEHCEQLYAELGDEADVVRSLVADVTN